jgi:uncharacterized protein (TIGR02246 family)
VNHALGDRSPVPQHRENAVSGYTVTKAKSAAEVIERLSRCLSDGEVEAALGLYEVDAAFVPNPGTTVHGLDAIREALEGFAALKPTLTGEIRSVVEADGVALVLNDWALTGVQPDGAPIEMAGLSADVVRRQADGSWLVLIDDPWGGAA